MWYIKLISQVSNSKIYQITSNKNVLNTDNIMTDARNSNYILTLTLSIPYKAVILPKHILVGNTSSNKQCLSNLQSIKDN